MSPNYDSRGFEVGNVLDKLAYPAARLKRSGPPPSTQPESFNALAPRITSIRARPFAFHLRELTGRAVVATPRYIGPGLIKRVDLTTFATGNFSPQPTLQIFYRETTYVSANNLATGTPFDGTAIWDTGMADDQPAVANILGGIDTIGNIVNSPNYLLDYYVAATEFFLALVLENPAGGASDVMGTILTYEQVQPSDFPGILG